MISDDAWQPRLAALVDQLSRRGDLRSGPWRAAFEETPRHVFVPNVITISESGSTTVNGADPAQHQSWFPATPPAPAPWKALECNAEGQWQWIAEETGLPIAESIAAWLLGDDTAHD